MIAISFQISKWRTILTEFICDPPVKNQRTIKLFTILLITQKRKLYFFNFSQNLSKSTYVLQLKLVAWMKTTPDLTLFVPNM